MGDDDESSFISLKDKQPDTSSSETDDEEEDEPHSIQHETDDATGPKHDVAAASQPGSDTDETVTGLDMTGASTTDLAIPISLIAAGNILVLAVLVLVDTQAMWQFVMAFASVEVLIGAAIWFFHAVT